ncbi:transposase [Alkalibacterium pelagium]|uniref:Transposase n=1 Tax=Alkalibacterium pelagium TaxID=426702 RepID=A0A1H7HNU1_9LACT|nr:transposase [Alkalibacterium pelagium]GEN50389.1 transposase [Alkalibacterium pelagium]SEK52026.1 transposase [Alkalibacterium pelagium]
MQNRRKRRSFSQEFKKQVVDLYHSGKSRKEIIAEYDLTPSAFDKWVTQYSSALKEQSYLNRNQTFEQSECLDKLRKEIETLKIENSILKQTVIIFSRMVD